MASVIRNNTNLTKLTNEALNNIVETCLKAGVDSEDFEYTAANAQYGRTRKEVVRAVVAYNMVEGLLTQIQVIEPSPESRMWSSLEGGHVIIRSPEIDVMELVNGNVVIVGYTASGG